MITNDVQYRTAKTQVERLGRLVEELRDRPLEGDELLRQMELDAVQGQIEELNAELGEYDDLRSGRETVAPLANLEQLPELLVRARIAAGLKQRDLAERLGLKEQQIQRYEATRYQSASLARLLEVATAVGLAVPDGAIPSSLPPAKAVLRQLTRTGLDPKFVRQRLAPAGLPKGGKAVGDATQVIDLAARVGRVFGWDASTLLSEGDVDIDQQVMAAASFKLPKGANRSKVAVYTVYAHYLSLVLLQATVHLSSREIPDTPAKFREAWEAKGPTDFPTLLQLVWDLGIPVLPLSDPGFFHAAVWRTGGRAVIVLKQKTRRPSRWEFDLLHEVGHLVTAPATPDRAIVEGDDTNVDEEEQDANRFAGDVLLAGRAEQLAEACVEEAQGHVEWLKRAVPIVARREGVDVGALANYMAFRLALQEINWWGPATNLQTEGVDPWATCRAALLKHTTLDVLNPIDRELLVQAMTP